MPHYSTWSRIMGQAADPDELEQTLGRQLRMGQAPHVLAILNNTALGLFARWGETYLPHAQRTFAYHFDRALARLAA